MPAQSRRADGLRIAKVTPDDMAPLTALPPAAGIGLKPQHYAAVLDPVPSAASSHAATPAWLEVHPQNYFGQGGPPHRWLTAVAEHWPLSFHSVGLSLGSAEGLMADELEQLTALCDRYHPASVSEHLSWSGAADNRYPDLLPVPYTQAALRHFTAQVSRVQDRLRRAILIENPSRYLAFAGDEIDEAGFLHALCRAAGCGILLDINNIEVSATNLGLDGRAMVDAIDPTLVGEIHVAGHAREDHASGPLLIDDHGSAVSEVTWDLLRRFITRAGPRPVLVEWDTDVPAYETMLDEAAKASAIIAKAGSVRMREAADANA